MIEPAPGRRPAWLSDALFPFESRFVSVAGHRLHYVDEGEGPVLVGCCVERSRSLWDPARAMLRDRSTGRSSRA